MKFEDLQNIVYKDLPINNISWWKRMCLFFKPTYLAFDPAIEGSDYSAAVYFKTIKGEVFITKIERLKP